MSNVKSLKIIPSTHCEYSYQHLLVALTQHICTYIFKAVQLKPRVSYFVHILCSMHSDMKTGETTRIFMQQEGGVCLHCEGL